MDASRLRHRLLLWSVGTLVLPGVVPAGALADPQVVMEVADVPGSDAQPNGPTYDFAIGIYEVTNAQFAAFLNDALNNLNNERGYYMYFDTDSGDVYVHAAQTGVTGTAGSGTLMFEAASAVIEYQAGGYVVDAVDEDHPVTGVSWFGAVKFCNWLTLDRGLGADRRAYTEGGTTQDWHPVSITTADWQTRDLNTVERDALASDVLGYRLPMDEHSITASPYNEWYKAASWNGTGNTQYGFGRDIADIQDANYWNSGDPFEPGTTPAGMYDGTAYAADHFFPGSPAFTTRDTDNLYGLYDVSGNVFEWVQDQIGSPTWRRARGGYYEFGVMGITTTTTIESSIMAGPGYWHGFRVAHSSPYIAPAAEPVDVTTTGFSGPQGGPFAPASLQYTVTNACWKMINWDIVSDRNWLLVDGAPSCSGQLDAFESASVSVTLDETVANSLTESQTATLTFSDLEGTFAVFTVGLTLTDSLTVTPAAPFDSAGPVGGPFVPATKLYRIVNDLEPSRPMSWTVTPGASWVLANGQAQASGFLSPDVSADVTLSFDGAQVGALPAGTVLDTTVVFEETTEGRSAVRTVTLTVGDAPLTIPMAIVPTGDSQPGGPVHKFRIGLYEITNAEFAAFLNSAFRADSRTNGRGEYMYHDTDTGDVYINSNGSAGEDGTTGSGTLLFDASDGQAISFVTDAYTVAPGEEEFPVVGVSWYGAAKFCNWLTLVQGGDELQRVYNEGTAPEDWYPVVAAVPDDDLTDAERLDLVTHYTGYRLPMDDGATGASLYNEWYKAAAWSGAANTTYGFGRDTLTAADANYENSGDPYDDGPTPAGYYDGTTHGAFATNDTSNRYGLYDLCGNVSEWVQDWGIASDTGASRGGHWSNTAAAALNNLAVSIDNTWQTRAWTGFRVVQAGTLTPVSVTSTACGDEPECNYRAAGPAGGAFEPPQFSYTLDNESDAPIEWSACVDQTWVTIDGGQQVSGVIPWGGSRDLTIALAPDAENLMPPETPYLIMTTVPVTEAQPAGPRYSFRMASFEITNGDFVEFLNDALANCANARGQYLYHDTDDHRVYINPGGVDGQVGTDGSGTLVFDGTAGGAIAYDQSESRYASVDGLEDHPVVGVSWYGAVKFCNWLTVAGGLGSGQRAYTEGNDPGDWHPVVIDATSWGVRDLNEDERLDLVEDYAGYRLPMDHASAGASRYNEWYKAAAWTGTSNAVYGFGRNTLTGADANYSNSGDPLDNGTTPVGYFDGSTHEGFVTAATSNGFHDLTGNVREWMQDFGAGPSDRAVRGGSWGDSASAFALRADGRETRPPGQVDAFTGFRVVQAKLDHIATLTFSDITTGDTFTRQTRLLVWEPLSFTPDDGLIASGLFGGPFAPDSITYDIRSESASTMQWRVSSDEPWVAVDGLSEQTGELMSADTPSVEVALSADAYALAPGEYAATITLENLTTGYAETRAVELTVGEPLQVSPDEGYEVTTLFETPVAADPKNYDLTNMLTTPMTYSVMSDQSWISLNGAASIPNTMLDPGPANTQTVSVSVNSGAEALGVGTYLGTVTFVNVTAGSEITRDVTLIIEDPLKITPPGALYAAGEYGGVISPLSKDYTIENRFDYPIDWIASCDVNWVLINGQATAGGSVSPGLPVTVTVAIDAGQAAALTEGTHEATVDFEDLDTGAVQTRNVILTIGPHIAVDPPEGIHAHLATDGTLVPFEQVYTVTNYDAEPNAYAVTIVEPGCDWVWINYGLGAAGVLGPYESAQVRITLDASVASTFSTDQVCQVRFENVTSNGMGTTDLAMTVTLPQAVMAPPVMATVPAAEAQPNGPAYDFSIGVCEITNAQFLTFLNDALSNPGDERGQYLYHDTDSGNVYVHSQATGAVGSDGSGTLIFDAGVSGRIWFNGVSYEMTAAEFEQHPVAGVSWYGAVKFCNWLTIDQEYGPGQRCYGEGTSADLDAWRPVTVAQADWTSRFMNDAERQTLVTGYCGFRLPMDNNAFGADAYNEWYKAAAWRSDLNQNMIYGYGRSDPPTSADGNWKDSGDPFDNGTTFVAYYDGSTHDGFATNATSNGYGLYDMTGNVFEWMQDHYGLTTRAMRGGGWNFGDSSGPGVDTTERKFAGPGWALDQLGFRIARVPAVIVPFGDFDADGDVDVADYAAFEPCVTGPGATEPPSGCDPFDADVDGNIDLADFSVFQRQFATD